MLDGELVILGRPTGARSSTRSRTACTRPSRGCSMLAEQTPALFRAFDLLAEDGQKLTGKPFAERRAALEELIAGGARAQEDGLGIRRGDAADDTRRRRRSPGCESGEGVIAKQLDAPYKPGERKGMVKVKRVRTIDCVVVGWRPGKEEGTVGSLILGLYDDSEAAADRPHLGPQGEGEAGAGEDARRRTRPARGARAIRAAGTPTASSSGIELRPELVVEVTYDHASGGRIRHGSKILRWRDDKDPNDCTFDQLDLAAAGGRRSRARGGLPGGGEEGAW